MGMHRPPLKEYLTRFLIVLGTEHIWSRDLTMHDKLAKDKTLSYAGVYRWTELCDAGWLEWIDGNEEHRGGYRLTQKAMDLIKEKNDGNV